MSSISAGTTSTTTLIHSGDTTGSLVFKTNDTGSGGTTAVTIDTSQNVGIGTTSPSSEQAGSTFLQVSASSTYSTAVLSTTRTAGDNYRIGSIAFEMPNNTATYRTRAVIDGLMTGSTANKFGGYLTFSTAADNTTSPSERMRIDSSGNVGIGTSSPTYKLNVTATNTNGTTGAIYLQSPSTDGVAFYMNNTGTGGHNYTFLSTGSGNGPGAGALGIYDQTAAAYRMVIDSGGSLLVGTTTSSVSTTPGVAIIGSSGAQGYWLNNNTTGAGTSLALFYSSYSTANQTKFEVDSAGNVKSRTNSYGGFSDERLKQNIISASSQWNDIKSYDVVKFQMKSEQFSDEENPWMLGVIAQQVEKISPGLVDEDEKDGMKTVKYSILYMKAVKALQEAMARIETLEAKTDTQAETINALTARVVALESK